MDQRPKSQGVLDSLSGRAWTARIFQPWKLAGFDEWQSRSNASYETSKVNTVGTWLLRFAKILAHLACSRPGGHGLPKKVVVKRWSTMDVRLGVPKLGGSWM